MHQNTMILLFMFTLALCSPHKTKNLNKETVDDISYLNRDASHYKDGKHDHNFDHESVLGSHDAAEEFDHLPPEESKRRLRILATKMDANKDDFVDKKELTDWVLRSFKMLTEEEALDQLEDEDGDEDGKVTWEEHVAETYGIYDDDILLAENKELSEEHQMIKNDKELFKAADKDQDGILDKNEYSGFSHPEEFEHMHKVLYEQAMERRDKNKDGVLSFEEFVSDHHGAVPLPTSEQYILEKDRFDTDYDLNGDNKLSKDEVLSWLIPSNMDMANSEADHLIASSDSNKDGKLSIDEIVDHHEIFVGSEATDFGEHLHNTHKFTDEL